MRLKSFPTKKVKLTVDSAACIKYGIVPSYYAGQMIDTIYWTIKSNQIYKNDLMLLDLIASNEWKRPLYFASPGSVNNVFPLDSLCFLEGYVYKFMPVRAGRGNFIQGLGSVDAEGSYDILMKAKWGNLNQPGVYVDPESLNNSIRPKTNFLRVAQGLANIGQTKKALDMLNTYMTYFPNSKFPYDMYMIPYADLYYKLGAKKEADSLISKLIEMTDQNLNFYYDVNASKRPYYMDDIQTSLGILKNLSKIASDFDEKALAAKADTVFSRQLNRFQ